MSMFQAFLRGPMRLGWGIALAVLVFDQLSKWWILETVVPATRVIKVLPVFNIVLTWNTGISFGMFANASEWGSWVLILVAGLIVVWLARWLTRENSRLASIAIGLIIGGAVGNIIDRVRFGAVIDFLDVHWVSYHWPAFNVADSGIVVGAIILVVEALFTPPEKPKQEGGKSIE